MFVETFKNKFKEGIRWALMECWSGSCAKCGVPKEVAFKIYKAYIDPLDRENNPTAERKF